MFVKQLLIIGSGNNSIVTDTGDNFVGVFDEDNICGELDFTLPYYTGFIDTSINFPQQSIDTSVDLTKLKKGDTVQLYYNTFDEDPGDNVTKDDLVLVFDGYIHNLKLKKSKDEITYSFHALGTLGLANERFIEYQLKNVGHPVGGQNSFIFLALQLAGLQIGNMYTLDGINPATVPGLDIIKVSQIRFFDTDTSNLQIKFNGGTNLKEVLDDIKKRYALIIHQSGDGYVNIMTPTQILAMPDDLTIDAWEFKLGENMFDLDYGDLTQDINSVVVLGQTGVVGYAVDPVAVQLRAGSGNTPTKKDYVYRIFENRDLVGQEECQKVARNKLLNILKNYQISFRTMFEPTFMIGKAFTVYDNDKFDGRIFFIKRYEFTIAKNDVSCVVTGYCNSLTLFPEDIVLSNTGIADVDTLNLEEKELFDTINWNGAFS